MKRLLLSSMIALTVLVVQAQDRTVSGRIVDDTGEALIGASVTIKGTSSGTVTDIDGNFSLTVSDGAVLVVSYVGYATQEITVGSQTTIDVTMESDAEQLGEVVVIGYGTQSVKDATGAVAAVSSKDFNSGVIASPEQLIQGKTAGVQISSNTGQPGGGVQLRIRGAGSARSNNNPLFVVDGVPLAPDNTTGEGAAIGTGSSAASNPLSFLNPNDIESISILKDASASAIYGARGANGVVFITTKKGQGGRRIEYSSTVSISTPKKYDLLSGDAFLDGVEAKGGTRENADFGSDTDWQDVIFRTSISNSHNISYSQGYKTGSLRASFGYDNQNGVVKSSTLRRVTGRINGNKTFLNEKLNVQLSTTYSNVFEDAPPIGPSAGFRGDLIGAAYIANPTWPRSAGFVPLDEGADQINPLQLLKGFQSETNSNRILSNISVDYALTDALTAKVTYGLDYSDSERFAFMNGNVTGTDRGTAGNGRSSNDLIENVNHLMEATLSYSKSFGDVNLDFVGGYSIQEFNRSGWSSQGFGFSTTDFGEMQSEYEKAIAYLDREGEAAGGWYQNAGYGPNNAFVNVLLPSPSTTTIGNPNTGSEGIDVRSAYINRFDFTDRLQSYFGRANVNWSQKYIATFTLRADGSSRFGADNRYGLFPSAAFAWVVSQEDFAPDMFSSLKLRLGWGITGNQEGLGYGNAVQRERFVDASLQDNGNVDGAGSQDIVSLQTESLKWETTEQFSLGIDFGFSNERFTGSLDFYRKETSDLLLRLLAAQPAPDPFTFENFDATVVNQGFEVTLNYSVFNTPDFTFDVSVNAARNENEVQDFNGTIDVGTIRGQGLSFAFAQRFTSGQPLFAWYVREFNGYNADGTPDINDVQELTGTSALPTWNTGLSLNMRYKQWDMSAYLVGQFGQDIYNNTANAFFTAGGLRNARNATVDVATSLEDGLSEPSVSTRFLEDGDFVRMQNLTIGYTLNLPEDGVFRNLRIYANSQNLFLITGYSGLDPEVSSVPAGGDLLNGLPTAGIDYAAYPRPKVFTFGVNATF